MDIKKTILAGPLNHNGEVGGIVILFEDLVEASNADDFIFDTNGKNYKSNFYLIWAFVRKCWFASKNHYKIALHGTAKDFIYLGAILFLFKIIFGLNYHTRKFAGNFDHYYLNLNPILKFIVRQFLVHSEHNFFETHGLVKSFKDINPNTSWFPNYRSHSEFRSPSKFLGRFIYLGHVSKEKGIDILLDLVSRLRVGWTIDIYGPLVDYKFPDLPVNGAIQYKGILDSGEVQKTLSEYNCLLFPSVRSAEGYPGVLIEAFSVAVPVIATNLPSLREMIDGENGVLTELGNVNAIAAAMIMIADNYEHYRVHALACFDSYDKRKVLNRYMDIVNMDEKLV